MHARSGESSLSGGTVCAHHAIRVNHSAIRCNGGLLEWEMWARSDRHRLARPHKYAFIGSQIRLSRVVFGPPPRHQQTTGKSVSRRSSQNITTVKVSDVCLYLQNRSQIFRGGMRVGE